MAIDLNSCSQECWGCIKKYKQKHSLRQGDKFSINCNGIPKEYIAPSLLQILGDEQAKAAKSVLDPVTWAAENLDWHCLDPDGEIWKRKNPEEYYKWLERNPDAPIISRYHRPYQLEMLRCSSKYKVFRIGRQVGKSESIIISILYHVFTKPGIAENEPFKVVIITPFQTQIDDLFKRLSDLIQRNPTLQNAVKRQVAAPHSIELYNKSTIKGFTAGTKSGNNAGSVRGQSANMLVFDEADMLAKEDVEAAFATITNYPDATVWMSSTPTGRREKFYETCHSRLWKEFHFPSHINPMWTEELDTMYKEQLGSIAYQHEILAEFGEQQQGVFQNTYVQAAKTQYKYGDLPYNQLWSYSIGVDWNGDKVGTTISVLGFNPNTNSFYLVDRQVVSREGWTQTDACMKIAELNRIWRPVTIYVDKGFGGTQAEILKKFSYDAAIDPTRGHMHADSKIKDILHEYDFGSQIEIHDLITRQPVKKDSKPFLVQNLVRRFETKTMHFPESDSQLEKELLGYIIDRVTVTGRPVYKANNESVGDHNLDSLMLAAVGFTLQRSPFGKPLFRADVAFSGPLGQRVTQPEPGDTVILPDRRPQAATSRPEMNRTTGIDSQTFARDNKPGNHLNVDSGVRLWSLPGHNKESSRPNPILAIRGKRPSRRNI